MVICLVRGTYNHVYRNFFAQEGKKPFKSVSQPTYGIVLLNPCVCFRYSKLLFGVIYRSQASMTPLMWLNDLEDLLNHVYTIWDGIIVLTGDINIDCFKPDDIFNLEQMITKATRVTQHTKTLIDHIITNYPARVSYTNVIPCSSVSDHDAPVACINVWVQRFQACNKYIRNLRIL